ncbi:MAG: D-alanyl-D-alanine carboxypeptidase/D-alanyl-D-alanine-endopeptidase [Ectothiorhodospiraceae bacterium]
MKRRTTPESSRSPAPGATRPDSTSRTRRVPGIGRRRAVLGAALATLTALAAVANAAPSAFPALRELAARGAVVTAMAVDLSNGTELWRLHPRQRAIPASLTKLFTAAAAFDTWGPQKTFTTRVLSQTAANGHTLAGDLILLGGGDPALSTESLWTLAGKLRSKGITRVEGRLVVNESLFGAVPCATEDRCDARTQSRNAYDAPLSAAGVNYAAWCVAVRPGAAPGSAARVELCPLDLPAVNVRARVRTVAQNESSRLSVTRSSDAHGDRLNVAGRIAGDSEARHFYRATSHPARQTAAVLRRILALTGIRVSGGTAVATSPPPAGLHVLASVNSIPLSELVDRMLTYSNNYMADVLALDLLAEDPEVARPLTLPAAGQRVLELSSHLAPELLTRSANLPPTLHSGSGLTPENALCAADIIDLLDGLYRRSDLFPAFLGALSVPRFSPLGILNGGRPGWMTRIAVKSGSLNEPVSVYGVAGYFRTRDNGWGALALLVNGTREYPRISYATAMGAIREDVNRLLEGN